jgi:hypothetical protein
MSSVADDRVVTIDVKGSERPAVVATTLCRLCA